MSFKELTMHEVSKKGTGHDIHPLYGSGHSFIYCSCD